MSTIRDRNASEAAERIRAKKLELEARFEDHPEQQRELVGEFANFVARECVSTVVQTAIEEVVAKGMVAS
jgi:hypothetical protein